MRLIDADALKINSWGYRVLVNVTRPTIQVVSFEEIDMAPTIDPESLRPQWISVEDRLPEDWEDVLVLLQCGDCIVAVRSGKYWREKWCHSMLDRQPTHWMPLPELPDMEGAAHDS